MNLLSDFLVLNTRAFQLQKQLQYPIIWLRQIIPRKLNLKLLLKLQCLRQILDFEL